MSFRDYLINFRKFLQAFKLYPIVYTRLILSFFFPTNLVRFFGVFFSPYKVLKKDKYIKILTYDNLLYEGLNSNDEVASFDPRVEFHLYQEFDKARKGIFLDIGSFVGKYAIYMGKKGYKTYCVEPNPISYNILCHNIEINGLSSVVIPHNVAIVGVEDAGCNFSIYGNGSITTISKTNSGKVKAISLESLISENGIDIGTISLIKIDVEGYEQPIIESICRISDKLQKGTRIICELLDNSNNKDMNLSLFRECNFSINQHDINNFIVIKI